METRIIARNRDATSPPPRSRIEIFLPILAALLASLLLAALAVAQQRQIIFTVVDDSGQPVPDAQVTVLQPGNKPVSLSTDYAGRCRYALAQPLPYQLRITRPGYYSAHQDVEDPRLPSVQVVLTRQHLLQQQVEVTATAAGIDTQEPSDKTSLNAPEITNVPYLFGPGV